MFHSRNIRSGSFLTIFTLALLFLVGLGTVFSNGSNAKAVPQPVFEMGQAAQPFCASAFVAPEGMSLPSSEGGACKAAPAANPSSDWMRKPPHRHGYCRCSCGYPCQTSADCGGASCDPFITCC